MKARAALYHDGAKTFSVEDVEVADPKEGEVRVKMIASGLCHSDYHMFHGDYGPLHSPMIGGPRGRGASSRRSARA